MDSARKHTTRTGAGRLSSWIPSCCRSSCSPCSPCSATVTVVDPSEHMLDLARKRVTHAGISSTISFVAGTLEESYREPIYDAATCLLVLHFLQSLESKQALLRQISARLKPGAPFCLASIWCISHGAGFFVESHAGLVGAASIRRYSGERTASIADIHSNEGLSYNPSLFSNVLRIGLGFLFLLNYTRKKYIFLEKT
nr:class I SAM-dependent methyltransferase [Paenibacillus polymyxa]